MSLRTVHTDLLDLLATVPGLRVAETPAPGTPPSTGLAIVLPLTIQFDTTMGRGTDTLTWSVAVYVPTASARSYVADLLDLITTVKATLEAGDLTLRVSPAASFDAYSVNDVPLYGCLLTVEVTAVA